MTMMNGWMDGWMDEWVRADVMNDCDRFLSQRYDRYHIHSINYDLEL